MDLKDKFKSMSHKEDIKIQFIIKIKTVTGLSKSSYTPLLISWKRGSKKENTGEIKVIPRDGEANVEHTLNINATITKTPKGFEEKSIIFTIKEEKMNKKPVPLGSINVNLAQYAESKTEKTHPFPIKDKSKVVCNLYLGIQSSWLKVNGKTLVKAEGNQKEILSELGKQQIKGADGSDYFLQTEQDVSDPEQTDIGNDNFSDGEDEEDISFEDDSKEDKSNVSTLSRKSSNLSSSDKEGSISTPVKATSSINNNVDGTPSHPTTTTTSTSTSTAVAATTTALYEVKMKKYKKKLKMLKSELEKSKITMNSLTKERDDKVKEVKTMLDEMETVKERSKSVGNGVIADYTNQIDSLTNENKDLKQQLQRERNQSNQDSNQVTTLQNQVISLNQQLDQLRTQNTSLTGTLTNLERQLREANSSKPEDLQNALATVQTLHVELGQIRGQLATAQDENRNQFLQIEQERLKSNANEANANRVQQENTNLQQQLEHFERTIHLQLEGFEKEKLNFADELVELKKKSQLVDEKDAEISKLKEQLESSGQSQSERSELLKDIKERDDHINSLQDKLEALHDKIDSLESNNDNNNSVNESLMADKDREIEQLLLKVSNLEVQNTQFKQDNNAQVVELEEKLKEAESKLVDHQELTEKYESVSSQLEETTKALQVAQSTLENQLATSDDKLEDTLKELEQLKQQLAQSESEKSNQDDTLAQQVIQLEQQLAQVQLEKEQVSKELDGKLEAVKESFESEKIEISKKLDETLHLLEQLEREKDQISEQLEGKSMQLNQAEDLYKSVKQESESKYQDISQESQEKMKSLQDRVEQLTEQLDSANNQVSLLTVAAATAAATTPSVPDDYEELKEKVEKYKSKCKNYKDKISTYKDTIAQHEEEKEMISLENNMSDKDQLLDLKNEIQDLKDKNNKMDQEMTIYIDEITQLKSHISGYQTDGESKQKVIQEYQTMIDQLQSELDSNNQEKKQLVELLEKERNSKGDDHHDQDSDDSDNEELDELREKVKYQKEKIKSLKEDLESKDDEWIDEKVKLEETISKLESQVNELKSNNVVPVVVPTSNNNDEIVGQLELKNQSLESQLSSLSIKNSELSNEINNLQNSIKQQQSPPIGSPMSARSNTSNADMEDVRKELEENKIIESSIYWPEIDFDRNNVPYCGTSVWQMLDSIGGLSKPQNQRMLGKIVYSLEKSFNRSGNDCKFIAYWLSTVVFLLHKLHQTGFIQESSDPIKSGIEISLSAFVPPSPEIGGNFVRDLQSLALNIYSKLITITEMKLEKVLIQSIFLPESVILDHQKSPLKPTITSSMAGSGGMLSNGNKKPVNNINQTLNILDATLVFLKDGRISDAISNQFLNQVFFFINAQLTNHLLSNTNVCTTTQGLEVKMGVSRLKEWCSTTPYKSASQQLDSSHEASNLLVIDKSVFMDIEAIKSIFQKLNLHQIKQLLESYTPDELSPDSLPLSLKKAIDANWYQSYDISSLPLQIDSSKKLKL